MVQYHSHYAVSFQIKEVAAPYTSTPELRRFWEHDIRLVRDKNISRDNSSLDSRWRKLHKMFELNGQIEAIIIINVIKHSQTKEYLINLRATS